jgi:sugar lactone lactonase YvrE
MSIEAKSTAFHELVPPDAKLEKIAGGFQFTEGPLWDAREGCFYFSDILGNRINRWSPRAGVSVLREPSGMSNGLTFNPEGRLCACEHGNRRVSATLADGSVVTLADRFEDGGTASWPPGTRAKRGCGQRRGPGPGRLNSPNDLVFRSDGILYFTDPPYGLTSPYGPEGQQAELDFNGVFRLTPDGTLTLMSHAFDRPNGLAFSPDEKTLYIADTPRQHVRAFQVAPNGDLDGGEVFAELWGEGGGRPDGMKVDTRGNLWCTGPGGVWVFSPDGTHLGTLRIPERQTANVAWGQSGHDPAEPWNWLYTTSHVSLYRLRVNVPGIPVPAGR